MVKLHYINIYIESEHYDKKSSKNDVLPLFYKQKTII